jgi:hypothetical protein
LAPRQILWVCQRAEIVQDVIFNILITRFVFCISISWSEILLLHNVILRLSIRNRKDPRLHS